MTHHDRLKLYSMCRAQRAPKRRVEECCFCVVVWGITMRKCRHTEEKTNLKGEISRQSRQQEIEKVYSKRHRIKEKEMLVYVTVAYLSCCFPSRAASSLVSQLVSIVIHLTLGWQSGSLLGACWLFLARRCKGIKLYTIMMRSLANNSSRKLQ